MKEGTGGGEQPPWVLQALVPAVPKAAGPSPSAVTPQFSLGNDLRIQERIQDVTPGNS